MELKAETMNRQRRRNPGSSSSSARNNSRFDEDDGDFARPSRPATGALYVPPTGLSRVQATTPETSTRGGAHQRRKRSNTAPRVGSKGGEGNLNDSSDVFPARSDRAPQTAPVLLKKTLAETRPQVAAPLAFEAPSKLKSWFPLLDEVLSLKASERSFGTSKKSSVIGFLGMDASGKSFLASLLQDSFGSSTTDPSSSSSPDNQFGIHAYIKFNGSIIIDSQSVLSQKVIEHQKSEKRIPERYRRRLKAWGDHLSSQQVSFLIHSCDLLIIPFTRLKDLDDSVRIIKKAISYQDTLERFSKARLLFVYNQAPGTAFGSSEYQNLLKNISKKLETTGLGYQDSLNLCQFYSHVYDDNTSPSGSDSSSSLWTVNCLLVPKQQPSIPQLSLDMTLDSLSDYLSKHENMIDTFEGFQDAFRVSVLGLFDPPQGESARQESHLQWFQKAQKILDIVRSRKES